jgi:hypothetical protein
MMECWRTQAKEHGLKGIYIVCVLHEGFKESLNFLGKDIDALCEYAPGCVKINKILINSIRDYTRHCKRLTKIPKKLKTQFKGMFPSWDNTARYPIPRANVYIGSSPAIYKKYLKIQISETLKEHSSDKRLIFINAWNEWGEGCYLEPDQKYGNSYLKATKNALIEAQKELKK